LLLASPKKKVYPTIVSGLSQQATVWCVVSVAVDARAIEFLVDVLSKSTELSDKPSNFPCVTVTAPSVVVVLS